MLVGELKFKIRRKTRNAEKIDAGQTNLWHQNKGVRNKTVDKWYSGKSNIWAKPLGN